MIMVAFNFEFRGPNNQNIEICPSLLKLPRALREPQSSDAKDRMFALNSVAEDKDRLKIFPDHNKSIEAVFIDAAIAMLKHGQVDIILDATGSKETRSLPPWFPDWRKARPTRLRLDSDMHGVQGRSLRRSVLAFDSTHFQYDCYVCD